MKRVITYGTYDLLHYGHIALLKRARALGDFLMVALSSDEFNAGKGKQAYFSYEERKVMLEAIRYVDLVVPELTWGQKTDRLTPTLEVSPRVGQSENEVSVSSYLSTFRWATPMGSNSSRDIPHPASPALRADTGLWRGDCSAVIIHRAEYRRIRLAVS